MEKVNIRSPKGQAKVLGTVICMAGTLTITFWSGGFQLKGLANKPLIDIYNLKDPHGHKENWVKGASVISASKISWSLWLIFQGLVHKMYPAPLYMNTLICLFASLQSSFIAIFFARDANLWKLKWDVNLLTILYGGFVVSGVTYYLVLWSINKRGPVFVAMFSPLQLPIVGIFSSIAFNERLHVGSLVGALIIIIGLYCVLWGKSKDEHDKKDEVLKEDNALQVVVNDGYINSSAKTES